MYTSKVYIAYTCIQNHKIKYKYTSILIYTPVLIQILRYIIQCIFFLYSSIHIYIHAYMNNQVYTYIKYVCINPKLQPLQYAYQVAGQRHMAGLEGDTCPLDLHANH